jgi:DNA-3-methyladenine glycosylase
VKPDLPLRLTRVELPPDTLTLARYLIGKTVVRKLAGARLSGRIVETEAYTVGDASGHAFRGRTASNQSLFLKRGHAYIYLNYGLSFMLNVSSEEPGIGGGVLIRALEPLEGIEQMMARRRTQRLLDLTRGPGRLAQALGIDRSCDGIDLCRSSQLWLGTAVKRRRPIGMSVRIGITKEAARPHRFYERGNPFVSGPKWLSPP